MEAATFFQGTHHRVILGSPTKQVTSGRVCVPIRMPLDGESFTGMPEWVASAYQAVSRYLTHADPEVQQVAGLLLAFSDNKPKDELFEHPSAKASGAEIKNFTVLRVGDPDGDPEIELQFKAYIPYERRFWAWIGEMGGKEVYMAFPASVGQTVSVVKPDDQAKLPIDEAPSAAETEALAGDSKPEEADPAKFEDQVRASMGVPKNNPQRTRLESVRPRNGKSGPKELAAYHANQTAADKAPKARRAPVQ